MSAKNVKYVDNILPIPQFGARTSHIVTLGTVSSPLKPVTFSHVLRNGRRHGVRSPLIMNHHAAAAALIRTTILVVRSARTEP